MADKHNSILHVTQLDLFVDRGDFNYDPTTDDFLGGLDKLLEQALTKQVNLEGKVGLVVKVDPPGRWNPNNSMSREMGMDFDLAKAGMGTGLAYFPLLNSGDMIPKNIVPDVNTPDFSHKAWSRCGFVFTAPIDELSSLQIPQLCLFSNPPDRLFLVKKLNKNIPSLWVGDDPCKKKTKKETLRADPAKKSKDQKNKDCNVITAQQMNAMMTQGKDGDITFAGKKQKRSQVLASLFNKYFKELEVCSPLAQALLLSQCSLESGFYKPWTSPFPNSKKKGIGDITTTITKMKGGRRIKYRKPWHVEGGYIHLATRNNYHKFNNYLRSVSSRFTNLSGEIDVTKRSTLLRNEDYGDVHFELAVLSAVWYFAKHEVSFVRGPSGKIKGENGHLSWTCLEAANEFENKRSNKFISQMCTAIVNNGGKRWPSDQKWTPAIKKLVRRQSAFPPGPSGDKKFEAYVKRNPNPNHWKRRLREFERIYAGLKK